jgi:pyridoxamine 5'-phosphate oxidase
MTLVHGIQWNQEFLMSIGDFPANDYTEAGLDEADLHPSPFEQFRQWMELASRADLPEPYAMTLATVAADGKPSARMVLLRGHDECGFVFHTNRQSRKARELAEVPCAALVLYWPELERQVRIEGTVATISDEESDAYFRTRPRGSQISAWASNQSDVVPNRQYLEARVAELEREYAGRDVPRPPFWGGYVLKPTMIEFWQGRPNRTHDRFRYVPAGDGKWRIERLAP